MEGNTQQGSCLRISLFGGHASQCSQFHKVRENELQALLGVETHGALTNRQKSRECEMKLEIYEREQLKDMRTERK